MRWLAGVCRGALGWGGVLVFLAPRVAQAQDATPGSETSLAKLAQEVRLRIEATAGAWYPALSGDARFGTSVSGRDMSVDTQLGLEDNEPTFSGQVSLFIDDRWLVLIDAFDFSTDSDITTTRSMLVNGTAFGAGTDITGDFGVTSVGAIAGYDFFGNIYERLSGPSAGGRPLDIRVHLLGGVRGVNVDHRLAIAGGPTVGFDEWGATASGGARLAIGIGPQIPGRGRWDLGLTLAYGLGGSADGDLTTFDLNFGIHYTVVDHLGLVLGYRQIDIEIDAEDASQPYRWDGRLAGLFFGGEMKF